MAVTFEEAATEDILIGTSLTLTGPKTVTADYKAGSLTADGLSAVYAITDASALKPGDTTANGTYAVTTTSVKLELAEGATSTTYEEALVGNAIKGYVTAPNAAGTAQVGLAGATVQIKGGASTTTDANGFYKLIVRIEAGQNAETYVESVVRK